MEWIQIAIAALLSVLILLVEHYLPLQAWFGKLHATTNYILGMLGILLPLTGLLILWHAWMAIAAVWAITIAGGLAVIGAYLLDAWQAMRQRVRMAELESQLLRPEVNRAEIEHD